MSIRVAIIEDQKEIRTSLEILINGSSGYNCIRTFETAEEAIINIPNLQINVVLVDIHLPGMAGTECVRQLKPLCTQTQFIMCTSFEDSENIFKALKAGANGYLTKTTSPIKILEAISDVYNGGSPMSSEIARKVVNAFHKDYSQEKSHEILSKREMEILTYLSKGLRYKDVADKTFVSIDTVRTHVRNIYEKLQVNSRTEAINKVFNHSLSSDIK